MKPHSISLPILLLIFHVLFAIICRADDSGDNEPLATTLAYVPINIYRNGTLKLADWNGTNVDDISNGTVKSPIRVRDRTTEERLRISWIQQDILRRLGMVGRVPPSVRMANVTASSSLNGEIGRKLIDVVANAPPPTRSPLLIDDIQLAANNNNNKWLNKVSSSSSAIGVTDMNEYSTSEVYAKRLQSFYPSCGIPNLTDPLMWRQHNRQEMRLYFDLTIPKSSDRNGRTSITIMWAKLQLYVLAGTECDVAEKQAHTNIECNNRITITLYHYTQPLRPKHQERLRILDSRTIPASFQGSIDFNMQPVINYWQNMPDSNYGMLVKVEDIQGNSLQPKMYLQQMNCSDAEIPIPNLADLYGEKMLNRTLLNGQLRSRYPILDLMLMESVKEGDHQTYGTNFKKGTLQSQPELASSLLQRLQASYDEKFRSKK